MPGFPGIYGYRTAAGQSPRRGKPRHPPLHKGGFGAVLPVPWHKVFTRSGTELGKEATPFVCSLAPWMLRTDFRGNPGQRVGSLCVDAPL